MLCKNITKNFSFVTIFLLFCFNLTGCSLVSSNNFNSLGQNANTNASAAAAAGISDDYQKPRIVGTISSAEITESSGLVASNCNREVFWTHNDSGDEAFIFALAADGKKLGTWKVRAAKNYDWEDMATFRNAAGECFLYVGDIGNNQRERSEMIIYRVPEPAVTASSAVGSSKKKPLFTEPAESIKFEYPDMRHDAETLLVHPQTGDIYVLSKRVSGASGVYRLGAGYQLGKTNRLEKIADFSVPAMPNGFLTGGAISADGKRIVICDYFAAYELTLPGGAKNFDDVWKETPQKIELGERRQGEAVCYSADDKSIYATSEKRDSPLIKVERK
jgi:hypothetical protein